MRAFVVGLLMVGVLGVARPAQAQFQNHSIGLAAGYLVLQPDMGLSAAALPPAFALDATLYVEAGFDVGLRFAAAIQKDKADTQVVVLYPAAELRYFLREDYFRPFIGANLEFVHLFDSAGLSSGAVPSDNYVGIAPTVGFEYFVAEEWSVGLAGEFAGYYALNAGAHYSIQLWGRVATHF